MASESAVALHAVPDDELLDRLAELVSRSRRVEADLVAHIGEADERRLYARQAFSSMFTYCTRALHLSEAEAYRRITVARAARLYPELLAALRDGRVHLSGLALLAPLVTAGNCTSLLERATHRSKREVEELVAEIAPRPDAPPAIRKLPQRRETPGAVAPGSGMAAPSDECDPAPQAFAEAPGGASLGGRKGLSCELFPGRVATTATAQGPPGVPATAAVPRLPFARPVEPLSPARYRVQFTASAELKDRLERLQNLMRHEVPDGDLAAVIERAVSEKLERLEARRFAKTSVPRKTLSGSDTSPKSRHIPAAVRRAVSERTGDRCGFVNAQGRRCEERHRLEFHHRHPFGMNGDHSPDNVGLLCPAHNRLLAERDYGKAAIARRLQRGPGG
jgi:hypothetical protein